MIMMTMMTIMTTTMKTMMMIMVVVVVMIMMTMMMMMMIMMTTTDLRKYLSLQHISIKSFISPTTLHSLSTMTQAVTYFRC